MKTFILLLICAAMSFGQQLQGIIDIHSHGDPDSVPRKVDVLDYAKTAKAEGMRAIVLKNHNAPTAQAAYIVGKVTPGIEIFGGIALNRAVGGVNPEAVSQAAAFKGKKLRIVWMPTFDSENNVTFLKQSRPFVSIAKNGRLLPGTMDVLKIIAKENIVMATGHSSAAEDLLLVREAKKLGITHMVVTHPLYAPVHMGLADMKEAAKLGAYLEFCGNAILPSQPQDGRIPVEEYVRDIHAIGAEHAIISSDLGQPANPTHTEGWKQILTILRKAGITDAELDLMTKKNPAKLLGLDK